MGFIFQWLKKELHDFLLLSNIVWVVISRKLRSIDHVSGTGDSQVNQQCLLQNIKSVPCSDCGALPNCSLQHCCRKSIALLTWFIKLDR